MAETGTPRILAIDIGTSGLRAGVGRPGAPLDAVASEPLSYRRPDGESEYALDLDAGSVWRSLARVVRRAVKDHRSKNGRSARIAAVSVTSQRQGVVMIDRAGDTVYAGPNIDMRAAFQGFEFDDLHGDLVWRTTGHLPSALNSWSRLAWLREADPAAFDRVTAILPIADWVVFRLTGVRAVERALGVECGLIDVSTGRPATELAKALGLPGAVIPVPQDSGASAGPLRAAEARRLGVPAGLPVISAGPDSQCALAGMGVTRPGDAGAVAGWSGVLQSVSDRPVFDPARGLWTGRHVVPGRWVLEVATGPMGGAYEWLAQLTGNGDPGGDALAALDSETARVSPGAGGALAFLGPTLVDMSRVSLRTGGLLFPVPLAFNAPNPATLARAALESFAFAIRAGLERIEELRETETTRLRLAGGLGRSRTFQKVLAATLNRPVGIGGPDATLNGAIELAASAAGCERFRGRRVRAVRPDATLAVEYNGLYDRWREAEATLAAVDL